LGRFRFRLVEGERQTVLVGPIPATLQVRAGSHIGPAPGEASAPCESIRRQRRRASARAAGPSGQRLAMAGSAPAPSRQPLVPGPPSGYRDCSRNGILEPFHGQSELRKRACRNAAGARAGEATRGCESARCAVFTSEVFTQWSRHEKLTNRRRAAPRTPARWAFCVCFGREMGTGRWREQENTEEIVAHGRT
jgi:hypothetical protein